MMSDIEIARAASLRPIAEIGARLEIEKESLVPMGRSIAKLDLDFIAGLENRPDGKLILVTAMTPTAAGEGKTTTTVGLGDALNHIGKQTAICLREPSLGPCFGMKGGAAGGGHAQVVPMENINLHFTGDFHAISAAHNLLAAMVDNHIYWDNRLNLDIRRIDWGRVVDMNDRALRDITVALGGTANGFPRQTRYDITVASEIMAILCLAQSLEDLEQRLGDIIIGRTRAREAISARELEAAGAMTCLLRDALAPNLVQTLENNPAFVHGGPFANIAHGCNSVMATKSALKLADYVVTEAGFGADLGAEKFFDIKCRSAGLQPQAAVVVATARALKMHGGVAQADLGVENVDAVRAGLANLGRHVHNVQRFGIPVIVALNAFSADTPAEVAAVREFCAGLDVAMAEARHWAEGGKGAEELARLVVAAVEGGGSWFHPLYEDEMPLWRKAQTIAREIYGADDIIADKRVREQFRTFQEGGFGAFPVCMAKTQYSFSTDPERKGAPVDHVVPIREIRLAAGARFLVVICGEIMTMPGLPRRPAACDIGLDKEGRIYGLF